MSTETKCTPDFTINLNPDIEKIAEDVKEAFDCLHEGGDPGDTLAILNDILFSLYQHIFPGATRELTLEESLALRIDAIDHLLFEAKANIEKGSTDAALAFIVDARIALENYAALEDLPTASSKEA